MSPLRMPGGGGGVFIVSEDSSGGGGGANSATDGVTEHTMMLRDDDRGSPLHHPNKSKTSKKKYNDNMGLRLLSAMRVNGAVKMTDRNATNAVGVAAVPSNHPPPMREREDHLEMSLLPPRCVSPAVVGGGVGGQGGGDKAVKQDVTLMSILNHIAYVNNASEECKFEVRKLKSSRKSQIERVLQGTYASAALGFLLCIMETYRIYGPYGISADSQAPAPWPWFIFQTICR